MNGVSLAVSLIGLAASTAAAGGGCQPAKESMQELAATPPVVEADPYEENAMHTARGWPVVIYTRRNARVAPRIFDLPLQDRVSQRGGAATKRKQAARLNLVGPRRN